MFIARTAIKYLIYVLSFAALAHYFLYSSVVLSVFWAVAVIVIIKFFDWLWPLGPKTK